MSAKPRHGLYQGLQRYAHTEFIGHKCLHSWLKCAFALPTLQAGWQPSNSKSSRDEGRDTLQDELAHMFKVPATSPSKRSVSLFLFLFDIWENINE